MVIEWDVVWHAEHLAGALVLTAGRAAARVGGVVGPVHRRASTALAPVALVVRILVHTEF
jgi:hypothetical protein